MLRLLLTPRIIRRLVRARKGAHQLLELGGDGTSGGGVHRSAAKPFPPVPRAGGQSVQTTACGAHIIRLLAKWPHSSSSEK
jgi:hypothetical protein